MCVFPLVIFHAWFSLWLIDGTSYLEGVVLEVYQLMYFFIVLSEVSRIGYNQESKWCLWQFLVSL